jgi:hypothetical protein
LVTDPATAAQSSSRPPPGRALPRRGRWRR